MSKLSYSVPEAAAATGLSVSFISAAILDGRIKAMQTTAREQDKSRGGKRLIRTAELERFLDSLEEA